jgi:hypothetical protein
VGAARLCPKNVPHGQWLAWQLREGGGRIVGGLVAAGGNAAGDGPSIAGDRPAEEAGPVGVDTDRVGTVPAHPEDVIAVALGLVLHGAHARIVRPSSSVHAPRDRRDHTRPRTTTLLNLRQQPEPQPPHLRHCSKAPLDTDVRIVQGLARRKHFIEGQAIPYVQRRPSAIL